MAYFTLELDTSSPEIELYTPTFVLSSSELDIIVQSNEPLEPSYQEFYLIDSLGQRYSFNLTYFDNYFKGIIPLNDVALGIITIFVRVRDTVLNLSPLVSKQITLVEGARLKATPSVQSRLIKTKVVGRSIKSKRLQRAVLETANARPITTVIKTRKIKAVLK